MYNYIIYGAAMSVAALNGATSGLPDLDCAILGTGDHPFTFTMKCNACDVACVPFKDEKRIRIR